MVWATSWTGGKTQTPEGTTDCYDEMRTRCDRKQLAVHCIDKIPLRRDIVLTICSNNTRERLFVSNTINLSSFPEIQYCLPIHLQYNRYITARELRIRFAIGGVWIGETEHSANLPSCNHTARDT